MAVSATTNGSRLAMITNRLKASGSARSNIVFESAGFGVAEAISMGVSLGTVAVVDKIIPEKFMDKATSAIAKVVIEPYLDNIEKAISKCHLEECKVDETKTKHERACRLAHGAIVFTSAFFAALGAKLATRKGMNYLFGVAGGQGANTATAGMNFFRRKLHDMNPVNWTPEERMIIFADEAVHAGSFIYLNTRGAKETDEHIHATSKILQNFGINKETADNVSAMFWVWEMPNFLGMLAGGGAIFGKHAYGWAGKEQKYQKIGDILRGDANTLAMSH